VSEPGDAARIAALERELAELRAAAPAHSMPPSLLMRIEELEDQLAEARAASPDTPQPTPPDPSEDAE
jgi:hypothetical protein